MSEPKTITLQSSDGVDITVGWSSRWPLLSIHCKTLTVSPADRDVAERSVLIKNMLEDLGDAQEPVPIPNVESTNREVVLVDAAWLIFLVLTGHRASPQESHRVVHSSPP